MTEIVKYDSGKDWTFEEIDDAYDKIRQIAEEEFQLTYYPNQIEVITSEQMLDAYCITPDHHVLKNNLKWTRAGEIQVGDTLLGFDEHGPFRSYRNANVQRVEHVEMPVFCVTLDSGKQFRVTKNHQWLVRQQKGKDSVLEWRQTHQLRGLNHKQYSPSRIPKVMDMWTEDTSKDAGWLAGIYDGEGNLVKSTLQAVNISQNDGIVLDRIKNSLEERNIPFTVHPKPTTSNCNTVRILGTVAEKLKFLGTIRPERLISKLSFDNMGLMKTSNYENVVSVEPDGITTIVKITTSTGTFVCDGYPMHNSSVGMPTYYSHWSFGKQFVSEQEKYKRGYMGLAYEIVINSNPCISYLMEENTMTMQCLVMAHACFGHNSFFKNNAQFKQWTDAEAIIDYLVFAKTFIRDCEEKYGIREVEEILDAAHSLRLQGVDRYKRPPEMSKKKVEERRQTRVQYEEEHFDDIWRTVPGGKDKLTAERKRFPAEPQENLLYFIEKHAPNMEEWKREIIRIVRKIAQYFYPQMLTKVMNEGFATFFHYNIINKMHERHLVTDGFMLEFLASHTGVIYQRPYSTINPYALGFAMFQDIKRICLEPTEEDKQWFPDWAGSQDWLKMVKFAAYNFKDESFILQFLSPKVIRDLQLFYILDDDDNPTMKVEAIQNDEGYKLIREKLADQQNVNNSIPYINVVDVDIWGDRTLTLEHHTSNRHALDGDDTAKVIRHLAFLWGYKIVIKTLDPLGEELDETIFDPSVGDDNP